MLYSEIGESSGGTRENYNSGTWEVSAGYVIFLDTFPERLRISSITIRYVISQLLKHASRDITFHTNKNISALIKYR